MRDLVSTLERWQATATAQGTVMYAGCAKDRLWRGPPCSLISPTWNLLATGPGDQHPCLKVNRL